MKAVKRALPILGSIGGGLIGGPWGAAAGGGLGEALSGGNIKQDLIAAGTAGAGDYLTTAPEIGQALGLSGSIGSSINNGVSGLFGGTDGVAGDVATDTGLPVGQSYPVSPSLSDTLTQTYGLTPNQGTADLSIDPTGGINRNLSGMINSLGLTPNANTADLGLNNTPALTPSTQQIVNQASAAPSNVFTQAASQAGIPTPPLANSNVISSAVNGGSGAGGGGILSWLKNNAGLLFPAAGVAQNVIASRQQPKGLNQLEQSAAAGLNAETGLINSEVTGQLPPGQYSSIENQLNDAVSSIKAKYASMGLSGSTMEQQAVQEAQNNAQTQITNAAAQATTTGLQAMNATDSVYQAIMQAVLGQNSDISKSLANLAAASTGGGKPQINVTV